MVTATSICDESFKPSIILTKMIYANLLKSLPDNIAKREIFDLQEQVRYSFVISLAEHKYFKSTDPYWIVNNNLKIRTDFLEYIKSVIDPNWSGLNSDENMKLRLGAEIHHWFLENPEEAQRQKLIKDSENRIVLVRSQKSHPELFE